MAWIKADDKAIISWHTNMVTNNHRYSVTHNGHNTWTLHIKNVQQMDSGTYMCQVSNRNSILNGMHKCISNLMFLILGKYRPYENAGMTS